MKMLMALVAAATILFLLAQPVSACDTGSGNDSHSHDSGFCPMTAGAATGYATAVDLGALNTLQLLAGIQIVLTLALAIIAYAIYSAMKNKKETRRGFGK